MHMAKPIFESKYKEGMRLTYGPKADLDETDWRILDLISQNARLPVSKIARQLGLTREIVNYRIRKMIDEDVIVAFLTVANFPRTGYDIWGYMNLTFKDRTPEREREFIDFVRKMPYVVFAHTTLGSWNFGLEFFAKDVGHFFDLQNEITNRFSDIIKDAETGVYVDVYRMTYTPPKELVVKAKGPSKNK